MQLPSNEVAALAVLISDGCEINAGDVFPCGHQPSNPLFGASQRYITATPDLLALAHALVDEWRSNFDAP